MFLAFLAITLFFDDIPRLHVLLVLFSRYTSRKSFEVGLPGVEAGIYVCGGVYAGLGGGSGYCIRHWRCLVASGEGRGIRYGVEGPEEL